MNKNFKLLPHEIIEILDWKGADGCFASDRITVDGCQVGFAYRETPDNDTDSGWRFLAGDENDEYMDNPNHCGIYKLNTICNYDNDIISILNSPPGSSFIKNRNGEFILCN